VWLEVHPPVDEQGQRAEADVEGFYALANAALGETPAAIHWDFVLQSLSEASGLPQLIGLELEPDAPPEALPVPAPVQPEAPAAAIPPAAPATR
jgi:hypothetical protein